MTIETLEAIATCLFPVGLVIYGFATGKMPASPYSSFVRDENSLGFWFMAIFWLTMALLVFWLAFVGPIV